MDIEKLIETLRQHGVSCVRAYGKYCSICDEAATALSTLQAENEKMQEELARVTAERDAAQALLGEISGVIGSAPITAAFGVPLERIRELVGADRTGKIPRYTAGDTIYDRFGDPWQVDTVELHHVHKKYEWLYRCGHEGTDDYCALWELDALPSRESALKAREQDE